MIRLLILVDLDVLSKTVDADFEILGSLDLASNLEKFFVSSTLISMKILKEKNKLAKAVEDAVVKSGNRTACFG